MSNAISDLQCDENKILNASSNEKVNSNSNVLIDVSGDENENGDSKEEVDANEMVNANVGSKMSSATPERVLMDFEAQLTQHPKTEQPKTIQHNATDMRKLLDDYTLKSKNLAAKINMVNTNNNAMVDVKCDISDDVVWVASSFKYATPPVNTEMMLKNTACVVCQYPAYQANVHVCGAMACTTCDQNQHRCVLTAENRLTTESRWIPVVNISLLSNIISDVKVICHNVGCDFLGSRPQYILHSAECSYKLLTCCMCEEQVQRPNISQHEISCAAAVCPYCLKETTSKEVKEHAKDLSKCVNMEEFFRKLQHPIVASWVKNLGKEK